MFPVSLVSPVSCVPCPLYPLCPLCSLCPLSCVSRFRVCPVSLLPFQKNEMFGGVALVSCGMWRENFDGFLCFHMTTCGFFFARAGGQRMWFFMKIESKNTKFCLTCLKDICLIFNSQLAAHWFINLGDQLGGPGTPAKMFGIPKGSAQSLFGRPSFRSEHTS